MYRMGDLKRKEESMGQLLNTGVNVATSPFTAGYS